MASWRMVFIISNSRSIFSNKILCGNPVCKTKLSSSGLGRQKKGVFDTPALKMPPCHFPSVPLPRPPPEGLSPALPTRPQSPPETLQAEPNLKITESSTPGVDTAIETHMDLTVAYNKLRLLTCHREDYLYPVFSDVFISTFWDEIILGENTVTFWIPFRMMANDET